MTFGLSKNAVKQFNDLYCFHDETIQDAFLRVANEFTTNKDEKELAYDLLSKNIWRPNTPVWLNAGTDHKIFSACFVSELQDSMNSIYDIANVARKIFQFGSGIGIPIGNLREAEAYIYEGHPDMIPEGKTSGPLTFAKLFDAVGETTKSGGRVRRAAILLLMLCWHPDIMDFIKCKQIDGQLSNMNISVGITNKFMQCFEDKVPFDILTPYDGSKVGEIDPQELWDQLTINAHAHAEPGIIFIDNVNKWNPLIKKILIECCNPCGEQFLIPFGACNLSAINIAKFVKSNGTFDWNEFYKTVFNIMGFMNNLINVMEFPDSRYKETTLKYRPVGIGPMGLADAMYKLGLKYDGPDGRKFAGEIMKTMTTACVHRSALIAKENGSFFEYDVHKENVERIIDAHIDSNEEVMNLVKKYGVANCQFTTAQPTGTTALSCDASYGIEPMFGLVFQKNYIDGKSGIVANPIFREKYKDEIWFTSDLLDKIENNKGSLKGLHGIPKEVREVFVVAHDIKWKDRIDMQSELQKYCSNAISSTVNLPSESTKEEVSDMFNYAYKKGLKGLTIYRDGSKKGQPVTFTNDKITDFTRPKKLISNTYIIETGNGKMYVTICDYKGKPLEIFIHIGKSGQILNTFTESLGRVISIAFQNGVPVEEITKTLININSDKPTWFRFEESDKKPDQILSIPDGIAKLLNRYYTGMEYKGELSFEICEICGSSMNATEGCFSCPSCGHSKCS